MMHHQWHYNIHVAHQRQILNNVWQITGGWKIVYFKHWNFWQQRGWAYTIVYNRISSQVNRPWLTSSKERPLKITRLLRIQLSISIIPIRLTVLSWDVLDRVKLVCTSIFSSISSLLTAVKSKIASPGITISLTDADFELKSPTSVRH